MPDSVHEFTANLLATGKEISLSKYAGKLLLIVNVACEWGLTENHYEQLNILHDRYFSKGLVILGQPCNQFAAEEPKEGQELLDQIRTKYKAKFDFFERADVNGENATPLYQFLQSHENCEGVNCAESNQIKWNFAKFLVGPDGIPLRRLGPEDDPFEAESYIQRLLATKQ